MRWKPEIDDEYWVVDAVGVDCMVWNDDTFDRLAWDNHNVYRTEAEALAVSLECMQVRRRHEEGK